MNQRWPGAKGPWPRLIHEVRSALVEWGGLYVIENVPGARRDMPTAITLHGGMFGLGVSRPRLFESSLALRIIPARRVRNPVGVYGKMDGRRLFTRADGTTQHAARSLQEARAAMGIDWMEWDDLREAIPPAYTEHIGSQIVEALRVAA